MTEGPLIVIFNMITLLIENTVNTVASLFVLIRELFGSLAFVSAIGGAEGIMVTVFILAIVGVFLLKFFWGSLKTVLILVFLGFLILAFMLFGSSV